MNTKKENINVVIVSFEVNFWGIACINSVIEASKFYKKPITIYFVQNSKSKNQILHFKDYLMGKDIGGCNVKDILPYEDVFLQWPDISKTKRKGFPHGSKKSDVKNYECMIRTLARHSQIICWLIKYHLPNGKYLFIDHDCVLNPCFFSFFYGEIYKKIKDNFLVFPKHKCGCISLTSPMFYVNTEIRKWLTNIPDFAWMTYFTNKACYLENNEELIPLTYGKSDVERYVNESLLFDDTMYNLTRHIFKNFTEEAEGKISLIKFGYNEHIWGSATRTIDKHQSKLLKDFFFDKFRKEFFEQDKETLFFKRFISNIKTVGMFDEFAKRFLN